MFAKLLLMILIFREIWEHLWNSVFVQGHQVQFIIGFQEHGAPQASHEVGLITHIMSHPIWQRPPETVFESQYEGLQDLNLVSAQNSKYLSETSYTSYTEFVFVCVLVLNPS